MDLFRSYHKNLLKRMLAKNQHQISLIQKHDFHSLTKNYKTLYDNFSLLSYIERTRGVRIHNRFAFESNSPIQVDEFYIESNEKKKEDRVFHYLFQLEKSEFTFNSELLIKYKVGKNRKDHSKGDKIKVVFSTAVLDKLNDDEKQEKREYIFIKVIDEDGWIQNNLKVVNSCLQSRMSEKRQLKQNQIQYYYQEPQKIRNKEIKGKHLSIALQGGGSKGVAYIGVFEALRKFYKQNLNIKSVIGSSAGGILGLGICLSLSKQEIIDSAIVKLSNITQENKKNFGNDMREKEKGLFNQLKEFIFKYNLFDVSEFNYIQQVFSNQGFQQAFLKVIHAFNPSLVNLFTLKQENDKGGEETFATVYGLLQASLMTGNIMQQIAVSFLKIFYEKYNQNLENKQKIEKDKEQWARTVTFYQLFQIHEVQFTCTSVDLRDHILRFFNHKTTPHLPVCVGVQMTGSFPVVFQSQSWKESWGKYYVHYSRTRKEIDLEKVNFTDGGTLANFPVKYLDNEKMRPMYFAYKRYQKKSQNQTLLYGFGLHDLSSLSQQEQKEKEKKPEEDEMTKALQELYQAALDSLSFFEKVHIVGQTIVGSIPWPRSQTISLTREENPTRRVTQIPLFKFLLNLLQTFKQSKDKLTLECFAHQTFTSSLKLETIQEEEKLFGRNRDDQIEEINGLILEFQEKIVPYLAKKQPRIMIMNNFNYLLEQCRNAHYSEKHLFQLTQQVQSCIESLCYERFLLQKNEKTSHFQISQKIIQLNKMKKVKLFYECGIRKDYIGIQEIIETMLQYFEETAKGKFEDEVSEKSAIEHVLNEIYKHQNEGLNELKKELRELKEKINQKGHMSVLNSIISRVSKIKKNCTIASLQHLSQVYRKFQMSCISKIRVKLNTHSRQQELQQYVARSLSQNPGSDNVHVVFQSAPLAQQYISSYFLETLNVFAKYNKKQKTNFKIKSITTSNLYSIAAFLCASDFPRNKILDEICEINQLVEANPKIDKNYDSGLWETINTIRMKELQNHIWESRQQVYSLAERGLSQVKNEKDYQNLQKLPNHFRNIRQDIENTRDEVNEVIQDSLYFVLDTIAQFDISEFQNIAKVGEKLSLKIQSRQDYEKQNRDKSNSIREIFSMLAQSYGAIFKYFILQQTAICRTFIQNLTKQQAKDIWKGFITGRLLTTLKVKSYVCQKLQEMGLKRTTTLKEYYQLTSKHMHINFTAVQLPKNVVTIINHKTRPYMPVWAAIVSTCSLPLFFKPMSDRIEWKYAPEGFENYRIVNKLFSKTESEYQFLQSADVLVKFPLELVTNQKIQSLITNEKKQMFLNFAFDVDELDGYNRLKQMKIQRFNFGSLYSVKKEKPENFLALTKTIPVIRSFLSILLNYINSHDNLIKNIYQDQLAILPIRLGTIDFDKTVKDGVLSEESERAIEQAQYVVEQKLLNEANFQKHMFFKIYKKNQDLKILFFSFFNDVKGLLQHYHIFYKKAKGEKYHELQTEEILLNDNDQIKLKIEFPQLIKMGETQTVKITTYFHKINFSQLCQLEQENFSFVYKYNYSQFNPLLQIRPENGSKKQSITVISYFEDNSSGSKKEKKTHCSNDKCSNSLRDLDIIEIKDGQCYNEHEFQRKLKVKCKSCSAQYCVKCKFLPQLKNEKLLCRLDHEFDKMERYESFEENYKIDLIKCDYCKKMEGEEFFRDKKCQVTICINCVIETKHS